MPFVRAHSIEQVRGLEGVEALGEKSARLSAPAPQNAPARWPDNTFRTSLSLREGQARLSADSRGLEEAGMPLSQLT